MYGSIQSTADPRARVPLRRHGHVEVEDQVRLPDCRRRGTDRRRTRLLRRRRKLLCARRGQWPKALGPETCGGIGGDVITYTANGAQKVAAATGFASSIWPVQIAHAKIAILEVEEDASGR